MIRSIVALFGALTWYLQRSWGRVAVVVLCFLYVLNQGYWEETTESLTLIVFAVIFCMGVGVPIGIYAAHFVEKGREAAQAALGITRTRAALAAKAA